MGKDRRPRKRILKNVPKKCYFCDEKKTPSYEDVASLQKFVTDRGKIVARTRNGLCAKHQKEMTLNVKYARHLALIPFISRG